MRCCRFPTWNTPGWSSAGRNRIFKTSSGRRSRTHFARVASSRGGNCVDIAVSPDTIKARAAQPSCFPQRANGVDIRVRIAHHFSGRMFADSVAHDPPPQKTSRWFLVLTGSTQSHWNRMPHSEHSASLIEVGSPARFRRCRTPFRQRERNR